MMGARWHRILTLVGLGATVLATVVSALATQNVLAPTLATTIGGALTALITIVRMMQSPISPVQPPPAP